MYLNSPMSRFEFKHMWRSAGELKAQVVSSLSFCCVIHLVSEVFDLNGVCKLY